MVLNRACASFDDFALDLADGATSGIPCPPSDGGLHRPSNPLSAFAGESPGGIWSLEVFDRAAGNAGMLESFGLEVCTACGNGLLDPGEACDDGNNRDGDCCAADCGTAAPDGTTCSDGNDCTSGEACSVGRCVGGATITCDPCLFCHPSGGCVPPASTVCEAAASGRSVLKLERRDDPRRDRLSWTWRSTGTILPGDFGLPVISTDLRLCVFDQNGLRMSAVAPAGGLCHDQACWRQVGSIRYRDRERTPDGLSQMTLVPGPAKRASISVKGEGPLLELPDLDLSLPVTVRLRRDDGSPICWQATYGAATRRTTESFRARSD